MSWNYRLIFHKAEELESKKDTLFKIDKYLAIHEVYYDKDGNPEDVTNDPIIICGYEGNDSLTDIKFIIDKIAVALQKPILDFETLKEIDKEKQNDFSKSTKKKKQINRKNQQTPARDPNREQYSS